MIRAPAALALARLLMGNVDQTTARKRITYKELIA